MNYPIHQKVSPGLECVYFTPAQEKDLVVFQVGYHKHISARHSNFLTIHLLQELLLQLFGRQCGNEEGTERK